MNHYTSLYSLVEKFAGEPPQLEGTGQCQGGPGGRWGAGGREQTQSWGDLGGSGCPQEARGGFWACSA